MNNPIAVSLMSYFEGVEDPRDNRGKEHILLYTIVEDIELFGKSKQEWLGTFLELPNGIPCDDNICQSAGEIEPTTNVK